VNTSLDPKELADALRSRSDCQVQVGAVIVDKYDRVIAWGWNSSGPKGEGQCAEEMALLRVNPTRRAGATMFVSARRAKSKNDLMSKPCESCERQLRAAGIGSVHYRKVINKEEKAWLDKHRVGTVRNQKLLWTSSVLNYTL
jgi:deoxycytidylate deaminase